MNADDLRAFLLMTAIVLAAIGMGIGALVAAGDARAIAASNVALVDLPAHHQFFSAVPDGNSIELIGTSGTQGITCVTTLVDAASLELHDLSTVSCNAPYYGTANVQPVTAVVLYPYSNHTSVRIARHNPLTGRVTYGPVVMRFNEASDTHLEQIYGDGSLWLFDSATPQGSIVLRISPTTGQVENRIRLPELLYRPMLAVNDDGLWMAVATNGGYGDGSRQASPIFHVASGSNSVSVVARGGYAAFWITAGDDEVWVDEANVVPGSHGSITQTLMGFEGAEARPVVAKNVTSQSFVTVTTDSTGGLWATTLPSSQATLCTSPQAVVRFAPDSGRETWAAKLPEYAVNAPYQCDLLASNTQSTYTDGALYVLYKSSLGGNQGYTRLYRITP